MKKNKHKNSTVAIAALMGMTTAINPAFPTVHAQSMNDQNPIENQEISLTPEAESSQPQDNTYSKDALPIEEETKEPSVANTLEAPAPTTVQNTTSGVAINETNFPDPVFRQWVKDNADTEDAQGKKDGILTTEEIENVTSIRMDKESTPAYEKITDLAGVGHFTNLRTIIIYKTTLTKLNLASNTKLETIRCYSNQIDDITLPSTSTLTIIDLSDNKLESIDVSKNAKLLSLNISVNNIKHLDLTQNTQLDTLRCAVNELTSLDLSKNPNLYTLNINANENVKQIDLSNNEYLDSLEMNGTEIHTLDLSKNTNITKLSANSCTQLSSITLPVSGKNFAISIKNSNLTSLDVSTLSNLISLDCTYSKNLASLIFNGNTTNLKTLKYTGTQIQLTDFSAFKALSELNVSNANISSLDVSKNEHLENLNCSHNPNLKSINLSNNKKLKTLNLSYTAITEFNGKGNPDLETLTIRNNDTLEHLDLEKNYSLKFLYAQNCSLSDINLTNNINLEKVNLNKNKLTSLILPKGDVLTNLECAENSLKFLDASENTKLNYLVCYNNPLVMLDLPSDTDISFNYSSNAFVTTIPNLHLHNNTYDLRNLDPSITEEKLKNVKVENGTIKGTVLYVADPKKNASYEYNCGNKKNIKLKVTLETKGIYWTSDLNIQSYPYGDAPNPSISVNTGTITYSYSEDGVNFATPEKVLTHAGTFYVKAEATDPTYGTISTTKEFQILKAPITENEIPTLPSNLTSVSGNTLSTISLGNGWTWKEPSQKVSVNNSGYEAYLTVDDTNYDYSSIEGYDDTTHRIYRTLPVQVSKITNSWTTHLAVQDWMVNETPIYPTAQAKYGTVSFLYSDSKTGTFADTLPTTVGTWYVKAVVAGTADYDGLESDIASFTIKEAPKKAENSWVTPLAVQDWMVNETPIYPTAKAKYGTVSFLYSDAKTGTFTDTLPTTVGTWYVKAVVAGTADYEGLESDIVSFTIKEAPKEVTKEKKPEVKKEASPIVETSATVHTNPAKLLLVFLGACLAFFKKKTQEE